jgi:hypothetical protein
MMFNAFFQQYFSYFTVLLVEETREPGANHQPARSQCNHMVVGFTTTYDAIGAYHH